MPSLHIQAASRVMCPWFYCLYISFLDCSLIRRFFLTCVLPLPSLFDFSHEGIESAHTPRRMFLKSCKLYSVPLSLRAVFQSVPYTNSLSKWKSPLLKFIVLTLVLIWPTSLKVVNSTRSWSLQPRVPPVLTCLISSFILQCDRSSNASLVVGLSISWIQLLKHSRIVLGCLQLAMLLFQQTSRWLNFPTHHVSVMLPVVEVRTLFQQAPFGVNPSSEVFFIGFIPHFCPFLP